MTHGTTQPRTAGRAAPAFTLIEIIVVMVLVAIMAVVAVPKLSNLSNTRGGVAARMIARDLTYARERAIATGTRVWVVFNAGSNSYSVLSEDATNPGRNNAAVMTDPNGSGKNYVQYLNTGEFVGVTITSVSFDAGSEIGFNWVGKPHINNSTEMTAPATIVLSSGHTVTVQPATGLTKVTP